MKNYISELNLLSDLINMIHVRNIQLIKVINELLSNQISYKI